MKFIINSTTQEPVATTALSPQTLQELGLSEHDLQEVLSKSQKIELTQQNLNNFGDMQLSSINNANRLLELSRGEEFGVMGEKMNEVVGLVKLHSFNLPESKRSKLPILGGLLTKLYRKSEVAKLEFSSVNQKIESLLKDIRNINRTIQTRHNDLMEMYKNTQKEYRDYGMHIAVAMVKLQELGKLIADMERRVEKNPQNHILAQELTELKFSQASLDKRIGDMMAIQVAIGQTLPTIQIMQSNNRMLADKYRTIYEVTIPAWKNQFMLAWTLKEQESHANISKVIDDTTNNIILHNSQLLHSTATATARTSQRLSIDPETLKQVQENLQTTISEVLQIHKEGEQYRKKAIEELQALSQKQFA